MKKFLCLCVALLLQQILLTATASDYQFKHYDTNDGLSQNSVLAIAQDSMGFIWLGTRDGLNRFDGKTFKVYRENASEGQLGRHRIAVIKEGPAHELWVGTERGLYIYSPVTDSFRRFELTADDGVGVTNEVNVLAVDRDRVVIASIGQGVFTYDVASGHLVHYPLTGSPSVSCLYIDDNQTLWIGFYEGGLSYTRNNFKTIVDLNDASGRKVLDRQTITGIIATERDKLYLSSSGMGLTEFNITSKQLRPLISTADGKSVYAHALIRSDNELLMATESGLYTYDMTTQQTGHSKYEPTNPFSLSDNSLQTVFRDRDGSIWVGSYFGGVCYAPRMSYAFSNYMPRIDVEGSLHGRRVRQLAEAPDGTLWIGTEDAGLNHYDPATGRFDYLEVSSDFPNVQSICLVGQELWVGTFANGLKVIDASSHRMLRSFSANAADGALHDNAVFSITASADGHVYVGTLGGLYCYQVSSDSFDHIPDVPKKIVFDIMEDSQGNLWVAVYNEGVFLRPAGSTRWQRFCQADSTLVADNVVSLYETSQGAVWVTTDGNGASCYDAARHCFQQVPIPSYHPLRVVLNMVEDAEGLLWMTTNEGLICYHPDNGATRFYTTANGLMDNNFSYNSALCASDGRIYLGCQSGLVAFSPESFLGVSAAPPIVATELMLQGRTVDHFTPESPLSQSITTTRSITLQPDQNSLALKMAVLSYRDAQTRRINYILEGFDQEWQHLYGDDYIRYTNLPPGHYVLRVQDTTTTGKTADPYVLTIEVLRPWYMRWWAWLIYLIVSGALSWLVYRALTQHSRHTRLLAMEKFEHEKEQELYQSKISFFTNVAHEIRTPLTLIKGPLSDILRKDITDEDERENLHIMEQNVTRLLNLTNQLLDFRKTERDGLRLNFQRCNIGQLVSDVCVRFKPLMQQRGIEADISLPQEPLLAWVDREAFTKIVSNLMSNATKYCEHKVQLMLTRREGLVELTTRNDGPLIDPHKHHQIFTPFFRADAAGTQTGTGIGLALARSLAELHSGHLDILSDPTLNVFRLTLPVEQPDHLLPSIDEPAADDSQDGGEPSADTDAQLPLVLIVEDNAALQTYEKNRLLRHYRVLTADNGEQALQLLREHEVDIIVSDVMMEPVDGFELCRQVKTDVNSSHIPFILLTALTLDSAKVKGMESGADSYIEKPFSVDYLLSVIQNQLRSRQSIKQAYATSPFLEPQTVSISKADEEFMHRLEKVMAEHLTDSDFDINALASLMFMSRTNLNRKMRGMFDLTPNNYIKVERLKRAAQLLKQGDSKVNEVCYMVGFSSPSYFTQCFQKQFGLLPKDFISQQNA